jgi:hypothetical protein
MLSLLQAPGVLSHIEARALLSLSCAHGGTRVVLILSRMQLGGPRQARQDEEEEARGAAPRGQVQQHVQASGRPGATMAHRD